MDCFPNLHKTWHLKIFWPLLDSQGVGNRNSHMATLSSLLHWPGIEPGSTAWEAAMLTTIPPMHAKRRFRSWLQLCNLAERCKLFPVLRTVKIRSSIASVCPISYLLRMANNLLPTVAGSGRIYQTRILHEEIGHCVGRESNPGQLLGRQLC